MKVKKLKIKRNVEKEEEERIIIEIIVDIRIGIDGLRKW